MTPLHPATLQRHSRQATSVAAGPAAISEPCDGRKRTIALFAAETLWRPRNGRRGYSQQVVVDEDVVLRIPTGSAPPRPPRCCAPGSRPTRRWPAGVQARASGALSRSLDKHEVIPELETIAADRVDEAYDRVVSFDVRYRFVIDTATIDALSRRRSWAAREGSGPRTRRLPGNHRAAIPDHGSVQSLLLPRRSPLSHTLARRRRSRSRRMLGATLAVAVALTGVGMSAASAYSQAPVGACPIRSEAVPKIARPTTRRRRRPIRSPARAPRSSSLPKTSVYASWTHDSAVGARSTPARMLGSPVKITELSTKIMK